ncbi:MAG: MFS transporter [Treponema sp.]|nr:MFS transporter [Treponema sp.]
MFNSKRFSFSAIYFFGWAALATFSLDFVFYSEKIGFTNTEIGIIYAVNMLIGILFQPLFGLICDHLRSTKKMLIIMSITAIISSVFLPLAYSKSLVLFLNFAFLFSICAFMPLLDNWVAGACADEQNYHFGSLRLWGSIGYAIVALFYGRMTMYTDIANMYYGRAILFFVAIFIILKNQYDVAHRNDANISSTEKKEKPNVKALFVKKEYWLFFLFFIIFCFPINATNSFFPRLLLEKGSTNEVIALFSSVNALVEIPFFLFLRRLNRRTGSRGLILVGSLFVIIRLIGFTYATSIPMLMIAFSCVAPYVGFFLPGLIFYSRKLAPKNTDAFTLTSLQGFAMGFSQMLGSFFGGIIVDSSGIRTMYFYFTIVSAAGILLFILTSFWLKRKKAM